MLAYEELGEAIRRGDHTVLTGASLAALHVGLQLDAFAPEHVPGVVRVVHEHLGAPSRGAPLSFRLRLLHSCRAVAVAARTNIDGLRQEDIERTASLLDELIHDRDPAVATPAAAAMGALATRLPRAAAFLQNASSAADGRRIVAAAVVQWVHGERNEPSLERVLARVDSFGVAEAIRALSAWRLAAPRTIDAAVIGLASAKAPADVFAAATAYAIEITDRPTRDEVIRELRAVARPNEPGFALWSKRAERAWELIEHALQLRLRARVSVVDAASDVNTMFASVGGAVQWMIETESGSSVDAVEEALDLTFVASTLVPDLLLATSDDEEAGARRFRAWTHTMLELRAHRIGALHRAGRERVAVREAARKLARSIDATPKAVQREAKGDASPAAVLHDAHERLTKNKDGMLDRSLARLFALAMEVAPTGMPPVDALALMLPFPRKVLRHFASTFAFEGLEHIIVALVALGDSVDAIRKAAADAPPSRRVCRKLALDLEVLLRTLEAAASGLADGPLARGFDFLVRASGQLLHDEELSQATLAVLERGTSDLKLAVHDALARHGMSPSTSAGAGASAKRLRQLLVSGDAKSSTKPDFARVLPAALEGVLDAILVLRGALDPEAHGPPPGTIVGDFVVVKMLGRGGMGACLLAKARSVRSAPPVVLKLPSRMTGVYRSLFRSEALALLRFADWPHPGIVRFVAFNDGAGVPSHLVMEYVEGVSLEKKVEVAPLSIDEAIAVFAGLARAVEHAHMHGIGHYDIKPANVMLSKKLGGAPVLVDWGISGGTFRMNTGSPQYMAPERWATEGENHDAGLPSDVYALACVLCEIVSGHVLLGAPITRRDEEAKPGMMDLYEMMKGGGHCTMLVAQMIALHPGMRRSRVERSMGDAPRWVVDLVADMLKEEPADRPTAEEVVRRLQSAGR